jgi:uracil-DNA glycosylase family 4
MVSRDSWRRLEQDIVDCDRCPRLRKHCREVARVRRRMYRDQEYWGLPLPGFGDHEAPIVMVGLAPAAHGANRTGRMFTGDRSGDWLYGALNRAGLANRRSSTWVNDGLKLDGVFISAAARCAPPANKPTREEIDRCAGFLDRELDLLKQVRVVVALGKIAWDAVLRRCSAIDPATMPKPKPKFGHCSETALPIRHGGAPVAILGSYHPSQQNTQTGRLTRPMFDRMIQKAMQLGGIKEKAG